MTWTVEAVRNLIDQRGIGIPIKLELRHRRETLTGTIRRLDLHTSMGTIILDIGLPRDVPVPCTSVQAFTLTRG